MTRHVSVVNMEYCIKAGFQVTFMLIVKMGLTNNGTTYTVDDGVENIDDRLKACTTMAMAPALPILLLYKFWTRVNRLHNMSRVCLPCMVTV